MAGEASSLFRREEIWKIPWCGFFSRVSQTFYCSPWLLMDFFSLIKWIETVLKLLPAAWVLLVHHMPKNWPINECQETVLLNQIFSQFALLEERNIIYNCGQSGHEYIWIKYNIFHFSFLSLFIFNNNKIIIIIRMVYLVSILNWSAVVARYWNMNRFIF